MYLDTLKIWHNMLEEKNPKLLNTILADDVVFYSPVVFSPQHGKAITMMYLTGAFHVLVGQGHFRYINETITEKTAVLEFMTKIDDVEVNGVDIIHFDEMGLIKEFKVMVRPLQAVNAIHQKMGEMLAQMKRQ